MYTSGDARPPTRSVIMKVMLYPVPKGCLAMGAVASSR